MSGLIERMWLMNSSLRTGEIIRGIELFSTFLSVNVTASRLVRDVAGAERILFVFSYFLDFVDGIGCRDKKLINHQSVAIDFVVDAAKRYYYKYQHHRADDYRADSVIKKARNNTADHCYGYDKPR